MGESGSNQVVTYDAKGMGGFFSVLVDIFKDFGRGFFLGKRFFIRDLRAMYRQSILGFAWALVVPLASAIVWIYLRSAGVLSVETAVPYGLFVITGIILWQTFLEALNAPILTVKGSMSILTKIYFPREALLISAFLKVAFNLFLKLIILAGVFAYYQVLPDSSFIWAPIAIVAMMLVGFAIGLSILPLGLLYDDVGRLIGAGAPMFFLLTPVVYAMRTKGWFGIMDKCNPAAVTINVARDALTKQFKPEMLQAFWIHIAIFFFILLIALIVYRISIPIIVERMGS